MYMRLVQGLDPAHFTSEFNAVAKLFNNPQVQFVNSLTAYIYGEEATPTWEQDDPTPKHEERKCAECSYYEWGRLCIVGEGHKHPSDCACESFYDGFISAEEIEELKHRLKNKPAA